MQYDLLDYFILNAKENNNLNQQFENDYTKIIISTHYLINKILKEKSVIHTSYIKEHEAICIFSSKGQKSCDIKPLLSAFKDIHFESEELKKMFLGYWHINDNFLLLQTYLNMIPEYNIDAHI